jgi:hypothetical protein
MFIYISYYSPLTAHVCPADTKLTSSSHILDFVWIGISPDKDKKIRNDDRVIGLE